MEDVNYINQDVAIVAYYFKDKKHPKCFPKRMEYNNRRVTFTETGLRHPTHRGKRMVHVFDMTDGEADYRLEFDAEALRWKLVYIADQAQNLPKLARGSLETFFVGEKLTPEMPGGGSGDKAYLA